jgi:hypothetical protein
MNIRMIAWIMMAGFVSTASAVDVWHQSAVRSVYPQANGSVVLVLDQHVSCSNANNPQYYHIVSGQNGVVADGVKTMLATALVAFATGKSISLVFDPSTTFCYVNRLSVSE